MLNRKGRNVALLGAAAITSAFIVLAGANPAAAPELDELNYTANSVSPVALSRNLGVVETSYEIETAPMAVDIEAQIAVPSMLSMAKLAIEDAVTVTVMPTGDQITAIGDSLMVGATDTLNELLPGIYVDGRVGRPMPEGMDILNQINAAGELREYVVLGLATNAGVTVEQFDAIISAIGPDRTLVMVNAYGDRSWIPAGNKQVAAAAAKYPGQIVVADWDGLIAQHPEYIGPDGIHANAEGKVAWANLVLDTVNQAAALR